MLAAIRKRQRGETMVALVHDFMLKPRGVFAMQGARRRRRGDEAASDRHPPDHQEPALLARERQLFARYPDSLASLIAEGTGAAPGRCRARRG